MQKSKIYITVFLLLFSISNNYAQVNALFTSTDSIGCNSMVIHFINQSTGSGTLNYSWDFGNGQTSALENPIIAYTDTGTYTVMLIVWNSQASDTLIKDNYIIIHSEPIVSFSYDDYLATCTPAEVKFVNNSQSGDSAIDQYVWDFGDNSFSSEINPVHIYNEEGYFNVVLTATDVNGCQSSSLKQNYIQVLSNPDLDFTSDIQKTCNDSLWVQFNNLSEASYALNYNWDFGNGSTSQSEHPAQLFESYGMFSVKLKSWSENGCTDSIFKPNYIQLNQLEASAEISDEIVCKNIPIDIINNSQGANRYFWDFGDGTSSNLFLPEKAYTDSGWHQIEYIAYFNNVCSDTIHDSVYVDPLQAIFSTSKNYICQLPDTIQYTNQSINASSWLWKFGNGEESLELNPEVVYDLNEDIENHYQAFYSDTLWVESINGCRDSLAIDSNLIIIIPKVFFTPNDSNQYNSITSGCIPIEVEFLNNTQVNYVEDPIVQYKWSFGDGEISNEESPAHTFYTDGEFEINLFATNESGCENSYAAHIKTGFPQQANFNYIGQEEICGSEEAPFIDASTETSLITGWQWLFGDGKSETGQNPTHVFVDTGYMSVQLSVSYNGCSDSLSSIFKDSVLYIKGPAGVISYTINCDTPFQSEISANIYGYDSIFWNFGDEIYDSTNQANVLHLFPASGNYNIYNNAKNNTTGCTLEQNLPIFIRNLQADFSFTPLQNCVNDTVFFDASATTDEAVFSFQGNYGKYLWDFDANSVTDDTISLGTSYYLFPEKGQYNVGLIVKDINNCWDTTFKKVAIYKPQANFTINEVSGCTPLTINFLNSTISDTNILSWNWNFGDGYTSDNLNPVHVFSQPGYFGVQLIASDVLMCTDTIFIDSSVLASRPIPDFELNSQLLCFGDTLLITDHSIGNALSYNWDFGDGNFSTISNPLHVYNDTGYFNLGLYLVDTLFCDTNVFKPNFVYVQKNPVAKFMVNDSITRCYPALLSFLDQSESNDIVSWYYDFGDNQHIQNIQNPFHNYITPGVFNVTQVVKTSLGCTDTLVKHKYVNIGGPFAQIQSPDEACINKDILITVTDSLNIFSMEWLFDNGTSIMNDTLLINTNDFGYVKYNLILKSDSMSTCNKIYTDSIYFPYLNADIQVSDTSGCVPFNFQANQISEGHNKMWWFTGDGQVDSSSALNYTYQNAGTYIFKLLVASNIGCYDSISKAVEVFPLPEIKMSEDTLICLNDTIQLFANGGELYYWQGDDNILGQYFSKPLVFPTKNVFYKVIVTDSNFCINSDSVQIKVQQKPIALIKNNEDKNIIVGEELNLEAYDSLSNSFYWHPDAYFSCVYCTSTIVAPNESGYFYFSSTDSNNCFEITDSIYVNVEYKFSLDMPNAFTPNGDGRNDLIYVKGWGIKELIEFKVYDTFGKLVFQTNDLDKPWDGTNHSESLPIGTYYYTVTTLGYDNKTLSKQGYFHLLK